MGYSLQLSRVVEIYGAGVRYGARGEMDGGGGGYGDVWYEW